MAASNSNSGSIVGVLVFIAIVGGLTLFNQARAKGEAEKSCKSNMGSTLEPGETEVFCKCLGEEAVKEMGFGPFLPFVGRFLRPDEAKARSMGEKAAYSCMAKGF